MSPSGRFQSRVFSQLSQQTLRWRDQAARWLRQAQVTAVWGAQILLYPVYAVFQSGRLVGRQLEQTMRQMRPRLQTAQRAVQTITQTAQVPSSPTADTPIRKTLRAVEALGLDLSAGLPVTLSPVAGLRDGFVSPTGTPPQQPMLAAQSQPRSPSALLEAAAPSGSTPESIYSPTQATINRDQLGHIVATVRGIASLLSSRSLVLVTPSGILDILTPAQQARLQRQMIWELAEYGRSHRYLQASPRLLPLPPPVPRETVVLPVKVFYRLMGWMQRSPVAIATNVFEETTLALYFPATADLELELEAIAEMDEQWQALADPTHQRVPASGKPLGDLDTAMTGVSLQGQAFELDVACKGDRVGVSPGNTAIALLPKNSTDLVEPLERDAADEIAIAKRRIDAYIETKATIVGYEKHPLERLLAWIDQQMLWLERRVINVWNWLRGLPDDT